MKTAKSNILNRIKALSLVALVALMACGFASCSDDKNKSGDPYFSIEGVTDGVIELDMAAVDTTSLSDGVKYTVRSNRSWKLVPQNENGWLRVFPLEGEDDGLLRISQLENSAPTKREVTYKVYLDGNDSGITYTIRQKNSEPYMNATSSSVQVAREGGEISVPVQTNVPFEATITETDAKWLGATVEDGVVKLTVDYNVPGIERSATLHVQGTGEFSNLYLDIPVTQLGEVILYENFSWLVKSEAGVEYPIVGWLYDNALRIDKWSDAEKAYGWTSRNGSAYAMQGFIKFGKTNVGGDVLSPALSKIEGTRDIKVTFQAVGYAAGTGAVDDKEIYVGVIGGGKVVSVSGAEGVTTSVERTFTYADANGASMQIEGMGHATLHEDGQFNKTLDPTGLKIWEEPFTWITVNIEGATAESQLVFVGGLYGSGLKGVGQGKNRMFIDNVKVEYR